MTKHEIQSMINQAMHKYSGVIATEVARILAENNYEPFTKVQKDGKAEIMKKLEASRKAQAKRNKGKKFSSSVELIRQSREEW